MKVITIIGRLTKDCEVRKNDRGEFATFSVAVDDGYGDDKGTIYFGVNYWRTKLAQYLEKGTQVGVTGEFKTREYEGKTYMSINASEVKLLGKKPENNRYAEGDKIETVYDAAQENSKIELNKQTTASQDFDDEIPF
tara:strand:- start:23 stop:433 length:411 start_codon:yes stop_codon:yes gene_type:complete